MINFIIFNVILLFAGLLALFILSIGVMACIAPMALFAKSENPPKIVTLPLLGIAGAYQIYFWCFWSAFCVAMTFKFTQKPEVTWDWLYWITGFMWCISLISWLAYKEEQSSKSPKESHGIEKGTILYSFIAIIAFLAFAFFPSLILPPYGWALKVFGLHGYVGAKNASNKTNTTSNLPEQFVDDRITFAQVKQLFNDAMDLTKPPDNSCRPFDMPKEQEVQLRAKLNEGISLSKKIDDSFLDYLNADLKNNFHNKYVRGYELILEGLNSDTSNENSIGVKKQLDGSKLINEFNKWWTPL
ncbi:MAG: hypothetical protein WC955_02950 [Elusimicrobiota bacterium]